MKTKSTNIEWLGEIPEHWEVWKLFHIFKTIGSGTTPNSQDYSYYDGGNINWLNTSELRENEIFDTEKKITDKALRDFSALKMYSENSLVIAMYGATIGRLGLLKTKTTVNQACCVLANPSDNVFIKFIFYFFIMYKPLIIADSSGGGQPNINANKIKDIKIPLPPLPEQIKIAKFLDRKTAEIDSLIIKKEKLLTLLAERRSSLISEAVTGKLTPDGKKYKGKVKESRVEWLGLIPESWQVKKLKFVGEAIIGITYTPNDITSKEDENGILVLRSSNIQNKTLAFDDCVYVKKNISYKHLTRKDDILLCARNGSAHLVGKAALIDKESAGLTFGAFMTIYRSKFNKFIYYFF